tara:strand:+ start:53 stop:2239 length:2187 start_codon:yes stop_codon:yes gene_type:complete
MARYTKTGTLNTIAQLNAELDLIALAISDTLSRVGDSPNQLETTLDVNSNRIINLLAPVSLQEPLRLQDLSLLAAPITDSSVVGSVAAMQATSFSIGNYVICKRYYADGALVDGLHFEIVAGGTGTADGGSFHNLSNGTQARIIKSEAISFYQFGAKGDNVTSDNTAIKNCIAYLGANGLNLRVPATATYFLISESLTLPNNFSVSGSGWKSAIRQVALNESAFILGNNCTIDGCRIKIADGDGSVFINCVYGEGVVNPTVKNNFLNSSGAGGCGVHFRNTFNSVITDNTIYGGKWSGGAGPSASAADILFYSGVASSRHIISGNYCLSNNSQGIFSDSLGRDAESIITSNFCITLDPATCIEGGAWSEIATGGIRRHGILTGYNDPVDGTSSLIVSDNICKNTRWAGIYNQNTGAVPRKTLISNNICVDNGFETGNTLAGGIYVSKSGNEQVIGNIVFNFKGSAANTVGAITLNAANATSLKTLIKDNYIIDSLAHGISISTNCAGVVVDNNTITGSVFSDIYWSANAGNAALGGHTICRNDITRINTDEASINLTAQASTNLTRVYGNTIKGSNKATVADTNAALRTTAIGGAVNFCDNFVENFYYGVYNSNFFAGTRITNARFDRNTFKDCEKGMAIGATTNVPTVPVFDNVFENVTTKIDGRAGFVAGKIAIRLDDNVQVFTTAAPTTGSWLVGDRAYNTASIVGQPKAWRYNSVGVWTSEGNL